MRGKKLKGQFFILGALALAIAFYTGLNIPEMAVPPEMDDMVFFTENLKKDIPLSFNFGLNDTSGLQTLNNFSLLTKDVIGGHYINYSLAWVVVEGITPTEVNMTFGNYWGKDLDVNLTVQGAGIPITLFVPNNSTKSAVSPVPGILFTLSVEFDGENRSVELSKDKINLYGLIQLKRGENLIREEIIS